MKTISKALIFIISISFLHAQDLKQSIKIPIQGKTLNYETISTGEFQGVGTLPIPNPSDYPDLEAQHLYDGSAPQFVQQIVTNEQGELLFFIHDNKFFDYRGICYSEENSTDHMQYLTSDISGTIGENYIIRNLQVVPLDNSCYQYMVIWHEAYQDYARSDEQGGESKFRYIRLTLNGDKTLSFGNYDYAQNASYLVTSNGIMGTINPGGFAVSKLIGKNQFIFVHDAGRVKSIKIGTQGSLSLVSDWLYIDYLTQLEQTCIGFALWEESEVYEKNGYYYYVFASRGSGLNIDLIFTKFDSNGYLIYYNFKTIGTYNSVNLTGDYLKGMEFSENGDYLYFTQVGKPLQYIELGFMDANVFENPGDVYEIPAIGTDYQYSHMELARDNKFYLVNGANGTLSSIANTNTPDNLLLTTGVAQTQGVNSIIANADNEYDLVDNSMILKNFALTKQIDQSDYTSYYTAFYGSQCCEEHSMYNVLDAFNAQTGIASWNAVSNPFNTGGNAEVYFKDNFIVPANADITITGMNLYFRQGKGIIINSGNGSQKGGKLTLNNTKCTVYDGCIPDALWAGITLNGSGASPQLPLTNTKQPQLHMLNNAEIEFANTGVLSDNGGVVIADQSKFTDNRFAVRLRYYNQENESKFDRCTFRSTNNLYDVNKKNTYVYQLVNLYTVKGIDFLGCAFVNNNTINTNPTMKWKNGWGINAYLSSFTVDKKVINNGYISCSFNNLADAIHSNNGTAISVRHSVFNNDKSGVWVIGTDGPVMIANNEFYTDAAVDGDYGVYIDACNGFEVTENTFYSGDAGIVVKNTQSISGGVYQPDQNRVYKNTFYNLRNTGHDAAACLAHGENSNYLVNYGSNSNPEPGEHGLDYTCNHYFGNDHNIAVRGTATEYANIDQSQGSASKPTGNIFYNRTLTNWDFYAQYTDVEQYQYHHYNLPNHDLQRNYDPNIVLNARSSRTNPSCPSIFSGGGAIDIDFDVDVVLSSVESKKSDATNLKSEVQTLKDGGQTEYLLEKVQNLTQQNYMSTSVDLLEASPYLSSEVLKAFMQNPINRPVVKTLVLAQNSPLPASLKSEIEYLNVPEVFKWYLAQLQSGVNVLEEKQQLMGDLLADADILLDRAILFSVVAGNTDKMDSLIIYLESKANLYADQKLMPLYEAKNDFPAVDNKLLDLDAYKNELTGDQTERLEDYILIKGIQNAIQKNPSNGMDIIKAKSDLLRVVAAKTTKEGNMAAALLTSAGYAEYTPVYLLPDNNRSAAIDKPIKEYPSSAKESSIYIYPNPVNDVLHVEYFSLKEQGTLEIFDLKGALVSTQTYGNALGYLDIPTSGLPKGTYILTLDGQSSQSVKFVVTH